MELSSKLTKVYKQCKAVFDGLRKSTESFAKLPELNKASIDFAVIVAVRDTLQAWDNATDEARDGLHFYAVLLANIANAIYDISLITLKQQNDREQKNKS